MMQRLVENVELPQENNSQTAAARSNAHIVPPQLDPVSLPCPSYFLLSHQRIEASEWVRNEVGGGDDGGDDEIDRHQELKRRKMRGSETDGDDGG